MSLKPIQCQILLKFFFNKFRIYPSLRTDLSFDTINIKPITLTWMKAISRVNKWVSYGIKPL